MELKVVCQCGQKFAFDVEPVNGVMPFVVNCPACNADGTAAANALLAAQLAAAPPAAPPPIVPVAGRLRINVSAPETVAAAAPTVASNDNPTPPPIGAFRRAAATATQNPPKKTSFGMGLLGGFVGALVGATIYFLIFKFTGLRFKLLAVGVGALAGWFAELFGKGEGSKELGGITAVFVLAGIIGAQYFVAQSWWHEYSPEKIAGSIYVSTVAEAKAAVKAVPTGSDTEIRVYLTKKAVENGEKAKPEDVTSDEIKDFRDNQLPEYQALASGQMTKDEYERKHELKTAQTDAEKDSEEGTFKGIFLLLLLSKSNLFSLAAAAGLAFKLSTNA